MFRSSVGSILKRRVISSSPLSSSTSSRSLVKGPDPVVGHYFIVMQPDSMEMSMCRDPRDRYRLYKDTLAHFLHVSADEAGKHIYSATMRGCFCFGARIPEETAYEIRKNIKIARWILPDSCDPTVYEKGLSLSLQGRMLGEDIDFLNMLEQEESKIDKERTVLLHNPKPTSKLTMIMKLTEYSDAY